MRTIRVLRSSLPNTATMANSKLFPLTASFPITENRLSEIANRIFDDQPLRKMTVHCAAHSKKQQVTFNYHSTHPVTVPWLSSIPKVLLKFYLRSFAVSLGLIDFTTGKANLRAHKELLETFMGTLKGKQWVTPYMVDTSGHFFMGENLLCLTNCRISLMDRNLTFAISYQSLDAPMLNTITPKVQELCAETVQIAINKGVLTDYLQVVLSECPNSCTGPFHLLFNSLKESEEEKALQTVSKGPAAGRLHPFYAMGFTAERPRLSLRYINKSAPKRVAVFGWKNGRFDI